jgi:hypothetical protein
MLKLLPDERINRLWQYWLPQATVRALQLAPNNAALRREIIEELRARHRHQVILLRRERLPWEYLGYYGRHYTNPFMTEQEWNLYLSRATALNLRRQRKEYEEYVADKRRSCSQ